MFSFVSFYSWQCSKVTIDKLLFCKLEGKVRGTKDIITVIGIIGGESGMRCLAFAGCICVVSQLWDEFGCMREKERVLGEEEGRTNMRGRKNVVTYRNCKN